MSVFGIVMPPFLYLFAGHAEWLHLTTFRRAVWMGELVAGGATLYFLRLWLCGLRPQHFRH